jgi:hypothetical protein
LGTVITQQSAEDELRRFSILRFVPVHEEGPTEEEIEEIVWREVVYVEGMRERIVLFPED